MFDAPLDTIDQGKDDENRAGLIRFLYPPPLSHTLVYDPSLTAHERIRLAKQGGWSVHYKRASGRGQRNRVLSATLWFPRTDERIVITSV